MHGHPGLFHYLLDIIQHGWQHLFCPRHYKNLAKNNLSPMYSFYLLHPRQHYHLMDTQGRGRVGLDSCFEELDPRLVGVLYACPKESSLKSIFISQPL